MEGRPLDPVAVREARKRIVEEQRLFRTGGIVILRPMDAAALLAALDEGREASAPFAAVTAKVERFVEARAADGGSPVMPMRDFRLSDFRRPAAFHALISDGESDAP